MKAAVVRELGRAPVFADFPEPVAESGEQLITVRAAGLHPLTKALAAGEHYSSRSEVPFVAGVDGIGETAEGRRVYFGGCRKPYGTMAEQTVVGGRALCIDLPDSISAEVAAGAINPGISSWLALRLRAEFKAGENVLILGATGVAGRLAVRIARQLDAARIIAAGRNEERLNALDADAVVRLGEPDLPAAFRDAIGDAGVDVVLDYLWGQPTEALFGALAGRGLAAGARPIRHVQVGLMAGDSLTVPANLLPSAPLQIMGSGGGTLPMDRFPAELSAFLQHLADNPPEIEVETIALSDVEDAWNRPQDGRRFVFTP
jgi:NADPH:quinone reductase-like Zn-dependent oxidoreductase